MVDRRHGPVPSEQHHGSAWLPWLWAGLILVVPAVFLPWAAHPFEPVKAALVLVTCPGLAAVAVWRWRSDRAPLIPLGMVAALAALVVLSAMTGIDPIRGLFGSPERLGGALTWLALLAVVPGLVALPRRHTAAGPVALALFGAAAIPAIYGLAQWAGLDPWDWAGDAVSPVAGTLGRSNFLGDLLAMALAVGAAYLVGQLLPARTRTAGAGQEEPVTTSSGWPMRRVAMFGAAAVLSALYGVVLVLTLARAAWLGAAAGVAAAAVLAVRGHVSERTPMRRPSLGAAAAQVVLLAGGLAGVAALLALVPGPWSPDSPGVRLTAWRWTAAAWVRRPLLGYGPDSLDLVLPTLWSGSRIDRAHNMVLDLLVQFGFVAPVVYVALVGGLLLAAWRRAGSPQGLDWTSAGAAGAVVAFGVITLFSFGTVSTWLMHWAAVGLLAADVGREFPGWAWIPGRGHVDGPATRTWALALGVLAVATSLAAVSTLGSELALGAARRSAAEGDLTGATAWSRRAVRAAPYRPEVLMEATRWTLVDADARGSQPGVFRAVAWAEAAARAAPEDAYMQLAAGEVATAAGEATGVSALLDAAEASFQLALDDDPRLTEARAALGRVALLKGEPEAARVHYQAAIAMDESHAASHAGLGWAELGLGHPGPAAEAFARATANDPESFDGVLGHGVALCRDGKAEEASAKLETAESLAAGQREVDRVDRARDECGGPR